MSVHVFSSSSLSSAVDPMLAIRAFRSQRSLILSNIQQIEFSNHVYAHGLISQDLHERSYDLYEQSYLPLLLDCLESRIEADPLAFTELMKIFESLFTEVYERLNISYGESLYFWLLWRKMHSGCLHALRSTPCPII